MTPEQTAQEVHRRLTETPEQREQRVMQEYMEANGFDRIEARRKDGSVKTFYRRQSLEEQAAAKRLQFELDRLKASIEAEALKEQQRAAANFINRIWHL
jgi:hypothetical protein